MAIELSYGWFVRGTFEVVSPSPFVGSDSMSMSILRLGYKTNQPTRGIMQPHCVPFANGYLPLHLLYDVDSDPQVTLSGTTCFEASSSLIVIPMPDGH